MEMVFHVLWRAEELFDVLAPAHASKNSFFLPVDVFRRITHPPSVIYLLVTLFDLSVIVPDDNCV
jgi:hypothetical protein